MCPGEDPYPRQLWLQQLEFIVNRSPAVAFLWRAEPRWPVEFVSENVRQFGYTVEEFLSGSLLYGDIIHPDDLPRVVDEVERYTCEGRSEFLQEYRILTRSGELRWVDDHTWVRRGPDGRVTHYQGIVLDITARKQVESELQRERDLARTLIEASPAFFVAIAPDGRTIAMNRTMLEALGYRAEEVQGTDYLNTFVPLEDRPLLARVFEQLAQARVPTVNQNRVLTRDGRMLWVEWHGTPVLRADGTLDYFFGLGIDVTERKKAQEELERRYRTLSLLNRLGTALGSTLELPEIYRIAYEHVSQMVDCANFCISLYDPAERVLRAGFVLSDGQPLDPSLFPPLRIEEGERLVGRARALLSGQVEMVEDLERARAAARQAGEPVHLVGEGEEPLSAVYVPMWVAGQVLGLLELQSYRQHAYREEDVALLAPVANQIGLALANARLYEQVRQQARELEQRVAERTAQLQAANQELEAFTYTVSHDLRAPLRGILGFSRLLEEAYGDRLDDNGRHYLDKIRKEAGHMERLLSGLLAFSRLTRQPLRLETVPLREVVESAWQELAPEREGRQVELVVGDLPVCQGDPLLLQQLFVNLLSNALKFTRPREVARIEVGCRETGTPNAPGRLVFYVRDNGVGFDMRHAKGLFGVFQRLHREEEFEGTGVGLAIARRIVQRHGGEIWAQGEVGQGATFSFTLGGEHHVSHRDGGHPARGGQRE
jgi:PAS domain S-box-containing protein